MRKWWFSEQTAEFQIWVQEGIHADLVGFVDFGHETARTKEQSHELVQFIADALNHYESIKPELDAGHNVTVHGSLPAFKAYSKPEVTA